MSHPNLGRRCAASFGRHRESTEPRGSVLRAAGGAVCAPSPREALCVLRAAGGASSLRGEDAPVAAVALSRDERSELRCLV
ncbi:hypothetical protein chiPu_0017104 [Chiloscyllium punctatum]|uniref:Uncharacterized protein n=1 Tax=Chiloscyllium punctatum TaxID=137246 RepID=A0A401T7G7_CHIPU|nr:hypothetical protein [Chiloscyllium punctatum]